MPFVQAIREKLEKTNISALNLTSEFDEFQLFCDHKEYITNTLDVRIIPNFNLQDVLTIQNSNITFIIT